MKTSRQQALVELLAEAEARGVTIHSDDQAVLLLDWFAAQKSIAQERIQAVTFGNDIFIRPEHAGNVRILREEIIHVEQQAASIAHDEIARAEVNARWQMIKNRRVWGITNDEAREMIAEIRRVNEAGRY